LKTGLFQQNLSKDRKIEIDSLLESNLIISDMDILYRVIENMVKNSLEATDPGDSVTINSKKEGENIVFSVHNPTFIKPDIQLQIFQRNYSTKGKGRGLGTYSMKLLTERYLNGKISFESNKDSGTTFYLSIPEIPKNNEKET